MALSLGGTTGNGWELRGPLIQEQKQASGSASCPLDFNAAYCVTISAFASNMTFFTTNRQAATTNYEHRVFVIRSGQAAISATWPAWAWLTSAPTNFGPAPSAPAFPGERWRRGDKHPRLRLPRHRSHHASPTTLTPPVSLRRANITTLQEKAAVNAFVRRAQARQRSGRICTPSIPSSAAPAVPTRSTSSPPTTPSPGTATVTHDANGITGDGLTGYGDTGYSPANGLMTTSSAHFSVLPAIGAQYLLSSRRVIPINPAGSLAVAAQRRPGIPSETASVPTANGTHWPSAAPMLRSEAYPSLIGDYHAGL